MKTKKFIDFCYHCFKVALLGAPILAVGTSIIYYGIDTIVNPTEVDAEEISTKVVKFYQTNELTSVNDLVVGNVYRFTMNNGDNSINDISFETTTEIFVDGYVLSFYFTNVSLEDYSFDEILVEESGALLVDNYLNTSIIFDNPSEGYRYFSSVSFLFYMTDTSLSNYFSYYLYYITNPNNYFDFIYSSSANTLPLIENGLLTACPDTYYYIGDAEQTVIDDSINYNKLIAKSLYSTGFIKHGDSFDNVISTINSNYVGDYNIDFAYDDLIDDGVLNSLTFTKLNISQVFGLSAANDGYDIYSLLWLDYYLNYLLSMGVLLLAFDVLYWFVRFVRKMLEKPLNRVEGGR